MSDYQLLIKIAGQLDGSLQSSVKQAQSLLDTLKKGGKGILTGATSTAATLAKANLGSLAVIATAAGKVVKDAFTSGMDLENAMADLAGTAGVDIGSDVYNQFKEAAQEVGRTTNKTSTEAAEALKYTTLAGWDPERSVDSLDELVKLSSATGLELGETSDLVTDSMGALNLTAKDYAKYMDFVATADSAANYSAEEFMQTMIRSGGAARALEMGYEDLAAAAGVLANNGIKSSKAGTALNSVLRRMATNGTAVTALTKNGVDLFDDATGEFRGFETVLKDINTAMDGMTDEERVGFLSDVAGRYSSEFQYLLDSVREGGDWGTLLGEDFANVEGNLEKRYNTMTDTLQGDLDRLTSAYASFGESIYESMNLTEGGVRSVVQGMTDYVNQIHDAFDADGLTGIADELGNIFGDIASKIGESGPDAVNAAFDFVDQLYQSIGSAKNAESIGEAAAGIVTAIGERFITNTGEFTVAAGNLVTSFTQGLVQEDAGSRIAEALTQAVSNVGDWFSGDNAGDLGAAAGALVTQFATSIAENSGELLSSGVEIVTGIVEGIISGSAALIAAGPDIVAKVAEGITSALPGALVQAGTDIGKALSDSLDDVVESWTGGDLSYIGENLSEDAVQVATESAEAFQAAMQDVWSDASFLTDIGMGADIANVFNNRETLDESQAAIRDYIQGWVDAGATVEEVSDQFNAFWEDQGDIDPRANQNFMDAAKLYEQMYEEAANRAQEASKAVSDATENLEAFGESGAESIDAVSGAAQSIGDVGDSIGEVGDSVTEVAEEMSEAESLITDSISSLGDVGGDTLSSLLQSEDMQGRASEITAAMETVATGVTESISTMQSGVAESMSALAESLSSASEAFSSLTEAASSAASEVAAQMATVASSVSDAMSGLSGVEAPEISGDPTAGLDTSTKEITVTMDASGVTAAVAEIQASMAVMGESSNTAAATFSAGMQVVASSAQSTSAAAAAAVMSMVAIMSASFAAAVASAQASAQGIYAAFASIDLAGVAANMMAGLTAGIEAGGAAAVAAAQNIASQVAAAMSSALQINSPSKVTTEIGYYTGMGLPVGLEKSLPETLSTVGSFTGAVANRMDNSMSAPVAAIAARSKAGTQAAGMQAGSQTSFSPSITININGNATEETAQTIASLTMDQFRRFYDQMIRQDRRVAFS